MITYLTHDLIIHLIFFQIVILIIILSNILILHRARRHPSLQTFPWVTILVPARNEDNNIKPCIQSLLAQDYPAYELLVLDDQSTDDTLAMAQEMAKDNSRLKVFSGSPPPAGWTGKNWACAQLAQHARGELFYFTDADTIHQPQAVRLMVAALYGEHADLLTGFPRQATQTWGEKLLVPFFSWAFLCFTPLWLAYRLRLPALSSAVGQLMLFRRQAYEAIGGHANLQAGITDDLLLARQIKKARLNWRVIHVSDLISCRMYRTSKYALNGLAKSLFAAFDFRLIPFAFVYLWLEVLFIEPLIVLVVSMCGLAPLARLDDLLICIGLSFLLWLLASIEMGTPLWLACFYPLTILASIGAAFQSLRLGLQGQLTWKNRILDKPKWRWF